MSLYIPSQSEIAEVSQSRGADSEAPDLWRGLVGWWPLQEGGGATAFDASGFRSDALLNNMDPATDWLVTSRGRALDFATTNQCLSPSRGTEFSGATAFTVSVWVQMTGNGSIIGAYNPQQVLIRCVPGFQVYTYTTGHQGGAYSWTGITPNDGVWRHLVVVYNGASVRAWLDTQLSSGNIAQSGAIQTGTNAGYVGRDNRSTTSIDGTLQNLCIWKHRALAFSEIAQLYADPWAMGRIRRRVFPAATSSATPIAVADAYHLQIADSPAIVQRHQLTAADAAHLHIADSPSVYHRYHPGYHPGLIVLRVPAESRTLLVPAANRTLRVPAESRTYYVPAPTN